MNELSKVSGYFTFKPADVIMHHLKLSHISLHVTVSQYFCAMWLLNESGRQLNNG